MNTTIIEYIKSKGGDIVNDNLSASIIHLLNTENHCDTPSMLRKVNQVELVELSLDQVDYQEHRYDQVEPHSVPNETYGLHGVVFQISPNKYRLIDGYHRLKWSKMMNQEYGYYILLKET